MDESATVRLEIARDLHDGIAQDVAALGYKLDEVIGSREIPQQMRDQLREMRTRVTTISGSIRDEIFHLRGLDRRPFREVIESLCENIFADRTIELHIDLENEVAVGQRGALIKIIQEALFNVKNHSSAARIEITQRANTIRIGDNGGGNYDLSGDRWGAFGMQERASEIGATIEFSSDGLETVVTIIWK
jgi:signal transduction histidine kinase